MLFRSGDDLLTPFLDRVPPVARAAPGHGLPGWPMATREVTAPIPDDANTVAFGLFLNGPGRIELRDPEFTARR